MAETGMVERVARAIWKGENDAIRRLAPPWDSDPTRKEMLLRAARAAIEAMREPTEEMVDAYVDAVVMDARGPRPLAEVAPERWAAMIDAALTFRGER